MDITVQINTPTLIGSQYFKVWYRLLPSGSFIAIANQTNAQFTITGLSAGNYELKAVLVLEDDTECEATFWPFTMTTPVDCLDFTVEIMQASNGLYFLEISYTPGYNPPCGWHITHAGGTTTYPTLPASPILIPTVNAAQAVTIMSDGCGSNTRLCFDDDVEPVANPCTPMTIVNVDVVVNSVYPNGDYGMSIVFTYTQSTPVTQFIYINVQQVNQIIGVGGNYNNPAFGPIPVSGTPSISVPLVANKNVYNSLFHFDWLIVDGCGTTHKGQVTKLL